MEVTRYGSKSLRDELRSVKNRLEILRLNNLNTYFMKEFRIYHI